MTRETSIEAFNKIKENGLLSEKRLRVYEILFNNGPLIGADVSKIYSAKFGMVSKSETVRNRLTELRNAGVVKEVGKSFDKHTGMKVILWDVTKHLPERPSLNKERKETCPYCGGAGTV
jgi:hypothetical protein